MSSTGFAGAPLSKMVSVVTVISTLAVLSNDSQDTVSLVGFRVLGDDGQWWRFFTSMFPVGSVWELMLCLHAIRVFRVIERHLGSAKFGSFLFLAAVLSKSIELALCAQFPFLRPPLGPLPTLSAVAVTYYGYVPVTAPAYFTVGNARVSEKFFAYVAIAVCLPDAVRRWLSCIGLYSRLYSASGCRVSDYSRFAVPLSLEVTRSKLGERRWLGPRPERVDDTLAK
eukprot:g12277.t2